MEQIKFYIDNIEPKLLDTISGKPRELIDLIRFGKCTTKEALVAALYDGPWCEYNYATLKRRTKRVLEAMFILNPVKNNNKARGKMQECRKLYLLAMSLIEQGQREEAKKKLLRAQRIAVEYNFTLLAYNCTVELMNDAGINRRAKKFGEYRKQKEVLFKDLEAERLAEEYYYEVALYVNKKRGIKEELFSDMINKLDTFSCTTTKFLEYYYMICVFRDLNVVDYAAIKRDAKTALDMLEGKKGVYNSTLQMLTKNKGFAHIALGEYEEAARLLSEAAQYAPAGSYNQGIIYYYQALNALHMGEYYLAYKLFRAHKDTKYETLQEQWIILGAYLYFLNKVGKLDNGAERFSIGKYLNETLSTAHDKTGNRVNSLIGELLVYLAKHRGKFIDRVGAIKQYNYQYLKGRDTQRARWFIQILCMAAEVDFDMARLQEKARKQFENLEQYPVHMGANLSIELIPFLKLLEMVMGLLQRKAA